MCLRCGKCCTSFGVCITPSDMMRICHATGLEPLEFVSAIPEPPERERTEPAVLIDGKRSLIVLKWRKERACTFYSASGCSVYRSRPRLCRTYPFVLKRGRLADIGSRSCPLRWKSGDEKGYLEDLEAYGKEIASYREIADGWNHNGGGSLEEFLRFLPKHLTAVFNPDAEILP